MAVPTVTAAAAEVTAVPVTAGRAAAVMPGFDLCGAAMLHRLRVATYVA